MKYQFGEPGVYESGKVNAVERGTGVERDHERVFVCPLGMNIEAMLLIPLHSFLVRNLL